MKWVADVMTGFAITHIFTLTDDDLIRGSNKWPVWLIINPFSMAKDKIELVQISPEHCYFMIASWYENAFHITEPLWGETSSDWRISFTKGQQCNALICIFVSWTVDLTVKEPVIFDTMIIM